MDADQVKVVLDQIAEVRAEGQIIRMSYDESKKRIMEIVAEELAGLDAEYEPLLTVVREREEALTEVARKAVAELGQTVTGIGVQAVFVRGRETWDMRALRGYAAAHPELMDFQKIGEPSVQIRTVSK